MNGFRTGLAILLACCGLAGPAVARQAAAAEFEAQKKTYLESVREKLNADAITEPQLEAATTAITGLAAIPTIATLELLSTDASKSGERLRDISVKIPEAEADIQEVTKKLAEKTGAERDNAS